MIVVYNGYKSCINSGSDKHSNEIVICSNVDSDNIMKDNDASKNAGIVIWLMIIEMLVMYDDNDGENRLVTTFDDIIFRNLILRF